MVKKKREMLKKYPSNCIYCGGGFLSSKRNALYDKNSCRVMYFKEKQVFQAAAKQIENERKKATISFAKELVKDISTFFAKNDNLSVEEIDKITLLFENGIKVLKKGIVTEDMFDIYLKERNKTKLKTKKSK